MTCRDIGEYAEQQKLCEKHKLQALSSMWYRLNEMSISANGMCVKKPKIIKYNELFPEMIDENKLTIEEQIENKWRKFLRVVR